jgi:hypothetical protein
MQMEEHVRESNFSMRDDSGSVNSDGQFLAIRVEVYAYTTIAISQQAFEGRKMSLQSCQILKEPIL